MIKTQLGAGCWHILLAGLAKLDWFLQLHLLTLVFLVDFVAFSRSRLSLRIAWLLSFVLGLVGWCDNLSRKPVSRILREMPFSTIFGSLFALPEECWDRVSGRHAWLAAFHAVQAERCNLCPHSLIQSFPHCWPDLDSVSLELHQA